MRAFLLAVVAVLALAGAAAAADPVMEADAALTRVAEALAAQGVRPATAREADEIASPAMVEERAEELAGLRLRAETTAKSEVAAQAAMVPTAEPRFAERHGRRFSWLKKLAKTGKKLWDKKNYLQRKLTGDNRVNYAQMYEDCMGCRLVWKQVEMDVSNARYIEDVQASFEHNCMDMQKTNIFYKVCEDMYDDMYAMTDDYMSNKYTVDQMCIRAKMCRL